MRRELIRNKAKDKAYKGNRDGERTVWITSWERYLKLVSGMLVFDPIKKQKQESTEPNSTMFQNSHFTLLLMGKY